MTSTLHSLCEKCIRKFPGRHYIKDQHCAEHCCIHIDNIEFFVIFDSNEKLNKILLKEELH